MTLKSDTSAHRLIPAERDRLPLRPSLIEVRMVRREMVPAAQSDRGRFVSLLPGPASPVEPQPEVAADALALAAGGIADRELIAALGIEAQTGIDLGRNTAGEFQPCRLLQQRHRNGYPGKGRRPAAA
jgi:hypothetical protein